MKELEIHSIFKKIEGLKREFDACYIEKREKRIKKEIKKLLRLLKPISPIPAPCAACGKHSDIISWHHITPIHELASNILLFDDDDFDFPDFFDTVILPRIKTIPLCPNCHAYIHKLMSDNFAYKLRKVKIHEYSTIIEHYKFVDDFKRLLQVYDIYLKDNL